MRDVLLYGIGDTDANTENTAAEKVSKEADTSTAPLPMLTPQTSEPEQEATAQPKTSFSVQIPWYVYAIGGGMLLLAGIVIFGKKKQ